MTDTVLLPVLLTSASILPSSLPPLHPPPPPHLGVVGPQHQPATKEEGDVEDSGADDEAQHGGEGEPKRDEQHVVLVKVAEEAQDAAPLGKDGQAQDDGGDVHRGDGCHLPGERGEGGGGGGRGGRGERGQGESDRNELCRPLVGKGKGVYTEGPPKPGTQCGR